MKKKWETEIVNQLCNQLYFN